MPAPEQTDTVQFGSTVTIARDDGRRQTWRIVGEDEAEPNEGTLSYVSPVARALMGKSVGDVVQAGNGRRRLWRYDSPHQLFVGNSHSSRPGMTIAKGNKAGQIELRRWR